MDLTEPDAGSDLQSVMLKATYSEEEGCWLLNGVKRFITNGDSDIHLVLARSEEGTRDGRGLSMFIYDKRQGGVDVRHIEHKLGIHGSPTCELVYKNAKAELCGSTRMGLIKYVMALMNGARLGIAAQSVGVSQAAYTEALAYAEEATAVATSSSGMSAEEQKEAMDILDRMREKIEKEEAEKAKLAAEARELGIKPGDVKSTEEVEAMIEAKRVEEAKPKTEAERLELTRKKAMNKLDFYERVVRSVAREEAEVAGYYEIMGEQKERPSIMDEQNQAPAETVEANTQEATVEQAK